MNSLFDPLAHGAVLLIASSSYPGLRTFFSQHSVSIDGISEVTSECSQVQGSLHQLAKESTAAGDVL